MTACIVKTNHKIIVFSENKSRFEVSNSGKQDLERHKVDGCLINDGIRCDWKLVQVGSAKEAYIELKGGDIEHAVDQIVQAVRSLTADVAACKVGYIVCTRSPLASAAIQALTKRVRKECNLVLRVKKTVCRATVEEVFNF